jgi:hypothetical protein
VVSCAPLVSDCENRYNSTTVSSGELGEQDSRIAGKLWSLTDPPASGVKISKLAQESPNQRPCSAWVRRLLGLPLTHSCGMAC